MKRLIIAFFMLTMIFQTKVLLAGDLEDGAAAYNRKDFKTAYGKFSPLAEQGDARAQDYLGLMYDTGSGVPKDDQEAVKWYQKAAEQGHPDAQYSLGILYANGRGITQNYEDAAKWLHKAADQGDVGAQALLGMMFAEGLGVSKDDKESARWYRKAAEQGHATAQYNLGTRYASGRGVPQDDGEAAKWYRMAAKRGDGDAQKNLVAIEDKLKIENVATESVEGVPFKQKTTSSITQNATGSHLQVTVQIPSPSSNVDIRQIRPQPPSALGTLQSGEGVERAPLPKQQSFNPPVPPEPVTPSGWGSSNEFRLGPLLKVIVGILSVSLIITSFLYMTFTGDHSKMMHRIGFLFLWALTPPSMGAAFLIPSVKSAQNFAVVGGLLLLSLALTPLSYKLLMSIVAIQSRTMRRIGFVFLWALSIASIGFSFLTLYAIGMSHAR